MMHPALQIQEILLTIFGHCRLPGPSTEPSDLLALARTCRTFKEPALDALWEELLDPSPLVRCLPEASHLPPGGQGYSFTRSLTQVEWGVLQNYTRRVRSMIDRGRKLNWGSVTTFLNHPTTEPLFPNLRRLRAGNSTQLQHLLCMPFPSLISLYLEVLAPLYVFQDSFESIFEFSPNIKKLEIDCACVDIPSNEFLSSYICRWRDLHSLHCHDLTLDVDALAYLSRISAFTQLQFKVIPALLEQIASSGPPLSFPTLNDLRLWSEVSDPISLFLSRAQLPAITDFTAWIEEGPSKQDLSFFIACVQTSINGHIIQRLRLTQLGPSFMFIVDASQPTLGFEDLQQCMAFPNLRHLEIDIEWKANLTSSELLVLASAWPLLERLLINEQWGWETPGGITPDGLLHLLQACPSLCEIALAVDTRGYTESTPSLESLGSTLPPTLSLNVLDSRLELESVPAIAAFLASIAPRSEFPFRASDSSRLPRTAHTARWRDAYKRANEVLARRS